MVQGTQAHNTVCVDGLGSTPYRRGKPKGPTSSAHLVRRHTEHGLDIVVARATSPQYRAVHERTLAFVGGEYWIVIDELADDEPHDYVARWHLDPSTQGAVTVRAAEAGSIVETPAATFVVLRDSGLVDIEDGWVSPTRRAPPGTGDRHCGASPPHRNDRDVDRSALPLAAIGHSRGRRRPPRRADRLGRIS
ncbi:MAG: heparinase II/III family protein [Acidimicrobiales bacterium]